MAQQADLIHVGPGRLFIGATPPATGVPPTLMAHTEGVPATGEEVGHTTGPTVATFANVKSDIESEQAFGVIDTYATGQTMEITFTAQERNFALMQRLLEGLGAIHANGQMLFHGGGQPPVTSFTLVITSPRRKDPTRFEVLTVYKCQVVSPAPFTWSRTDVSTMSVTLRGVHDTTRDIGDQLFQLYIEDYPATAPATISASSVEDPTEISTAAPHGFISGQSVTIAGHTGSTPDINGVHVVTVTGASTFTIPLAVTVGGTGGTATPV